MEISQLICTANQLTGFYMRATLAFKPALIALLLRNPTNFAKVNNLMLNVMRLKTLIVLTTFTLESNFNK